jgi:ribonuclease R
MRNAPGSVILPTIHIMEQTILRLLGHPDYTPSNVPQLIRLLELQPGQQQELQHHLKSMVQRGLIVRTKGNRFIVSSEADLIPGVIQITRGGRGFVQPDMPGIGEIGIPESATDTALHGDRVLVRLDVRPRGFLKKDSPQDQTGAVVRILERGRKQFVGTLNKGRQFLFVTPDDPRLPSAVHVPPPRDVGRQANVGDKVVVEILEWESRHVPPEGEIIEVLGSPDAEGVDMLSVIRHYDLNLHFPKNVLAEANAIARSRPDNQPSAEECRDRVDCRSHNVITIDPDDARDFDDAICLQRQGRDWRLWVHIADVSHYVKPGSPLDIEAKKRGNSTYLVDRVIPMLPEALSNELCSLKPGIDRLTKCVEFVLSDAGKVISSKFYPSVIHSKRRFTYKEAFAALQRPPQGEIEQMLHDANAMAQKIREHRFANGSLDLDFPENKIRLDETGKVIRIERIENDISHQLIEEYMLLANEAVAGRLMQLDIPAVYRVHESPKEKRLNDYREDVLSHRIQCGDLNHRPEVQKLLAKLGTLPIGDALKIGFLKSMMRARYAVEPLGHYGLAKKKYTHFTSPIRRYADLVVHRALFDKVPLQVSVAKEIAEHISLTEKNSSDAERDSKEVKLYAYLEAQMSAKKPQPYSALVTDVRNFGFFVDVADLGMSGLVPLSAIPDDFFTLDQSRGYLVGRHSRRIIKLGDRVTVQIYRLDRLKKQVDFSLTNRPVQGQASPQASPPHAKSGQPASSAQPSRRFRERTGKSNQHHGRQGPSAAGAGRSPARSGPPPDKTSERPSKASPAPSKSGKAQRPTLPPARPPEPEAPRKLRFYEKPPFRRRKKPTDT